LRRNRGRPPAHQAGCTDPAAAGRPARRRAGRRPSARVARPALRPESPPGLPRPVPRSGRRARRCSPVGRDLVEDVGRLRQPGFAIALLGFEALRVVPPDGAAALLLGFELRALLLEFAQELGDVGFVHDCLWMLTRILSKREGGAAMGMIGGWIAAWLARLRPGAFPGLARRVLRPGQSSAADVRSMLGRPEAIHEGDDGTRIQEYPRGPAGTETWMVE